MKSAERAGVLVLSRLARIGTLRLTLPNRAPVTIGQNTPVADLEIKDYSALREILRQGLTGFAESYMAETIETTDLRGLLDWGVANQKAWFNDPVMRLTSPIRGLWQRIRPEKRHPRVRSMRDHYNLGNEFYAEWLDETMTYSSGRFAHPDQDLDAAQLNKYRIIADKVGLEPGMKILEIGCGWGGFAEYAALEHGCELVAINLSEEQASFARERMVKRGLTDKVDVRVQDFRDVDGQFDAVVSIEMIESVDESHWPPLFDAISNSLKPGAKAAMQIITIDDDEWVRYRSRADFIQQYIFPGGQIPAPKVLRSVSAGAGLRVEQIETFGLDYARTLSKWQERFTAAWPDLREKAGLDERFRRMWDLYLILCEAGFRMGRINVEQWVFAR